MTSLESVECSKSKGLPDEMALASAAESALESISSISRTVESAAHELGDERRLALDALPHVAVEGPLGDEPYDRDLRVLVSLPHDAALALRDVGGPPRAVQVIQSDGAGLDVGADAHLLRAADQHGDVPGARGGEHAGLLDVGLGFVHEADLLAGHPAGDELQVQLVVSVPAVRVRRADVGEHQLQRAAHG